MNNEDLYKYYVSIDIDHSPGHWSELYPKYVKIIGRSIVAPHPHRHYNYDEFLDKLASDDEFRKMLENRSFKTKKEEKEEPIRPMPDFAKLFNL